MEEKKHDNKTAHQQAKPSVKREEAGWGWRMAVNLCRLPLSLALIFSGFVKAIDPLGTQYKIGDYLEALHLEQYAPSWATLTTSVLLSAVEFCLGVFLLFAIRRRKVSRVIVAFMAIMTAITVWLWGWEPIKDCGCFGDAIHLTNGETLLKNLLLLAMAAVVAWKPFCMVRFISKTNQWIVINYTLLFILVSSALSLWYLPPFDFRPYHIGADIRKGMEIPAGAKQPKFETTFILEKGGVRKEFTLDNYPDSTWTFIDRPWWWRRATSPPSTISPSQIPQPTMTSRSRCWPTRATLSSSWPPTSNWPTPPISARSTASTNTRRTTTTASSP